MKKIACIGCLIFSFYCVKAQIIKPLKPLPTKQQLQWQQMDFYLFIHFGPNTFTDLEWGKGTEQEEVFNPSQLNCEQWCRIAKASGAKGIIITAKHHDGFCLWPSKYSKHTVAQSKWQNGKGDVLKDLSEACKKYNLKFGVYLSPWDRNHLLYGTEKYNDVYVNMMKEIVAHYGPLFELWWDGANGEGPNGKKQIYKWHYFEQTIRSIAPNTIVFSDIGPDARWCGNENGFAGITNWNLLDTAGFTRGLGAPSPDTLNEGNMYGKNWIPAECDVSIRPGWFYHKEQDDSVKNASELFNIYLKSAGRGANLLLNVPPDRRGLISSYDSIALMNFKKLRDESFQKDLCKNALIKYAADKISHTTTLLNDNDDNTFVSLNTDSSSSIQIKFPYIKKINCIVLKEPLQMGQRIAAFTVRLSKNNSLVKKILAKTIGKKRILTFPETEVDDISIHIDEAKSTPLISEISAYKINGNLIKE